MPFVANDMSENGASGEVPEAASVGMFAYVNVALGATFAYLLYKLFFGTPRPHNAAHHEDKREYLNMTDMPNACPGKKSHRPSSQASHEKKEEKVKQK